MTLENLQDNYEVKKITYDDNIILTYNNDLKYTIKPYFEINENNKLLINKIFDKKELHIFKNTKDNTFLNTGIKIDNVNATVLSLIMDYPSNKIECIPDEYKDFEYVKKKSIKNIIKFKNKEFVYDFYNSKKYIKFLYDFKRIILSSHFNPCGEKYKNEIIYYFLLISGNVLKINFSEVSKDSYIKYSMLYEMFIDNNIFDIDIKYSTIDNLTSILCSINILLQYKISNINVSIDMQWKHKDKLKTKDLENTLDENLFNQKLISKKIVNKKFLTEKIFNRLIKYDFSIYKHNNFVEYYIKDNKKYDIYNYVLMKIVSPGILTDKGVKFLVKDNNDDVTCLHVNDLIFSKADKKFREDHLQYINDMLVGQNILVIKLTHLLTETYYFEKKTILSDYKNIYVLTKHDAYNALEIFYRNNYENIVSLKKIIIKNNDYVSFYNNITNINKIIYENNYDNNQTKNIIDIILNIINSDPLKIKICFNIINYLLLINDNNNSINTNNNNNYVLENIEIILNNLDKLNKLNNKPQSSNNKKQINKKINNTNNKNKTKNLKKINKTINVINYIKKKEDIDSNLVYNYGDESDCCPICRSHWSDNELVVITRCSHAFCLQCIMSSPMKSCSICRKDIDSNLIKYTFDQIIKNNLIEFIQNYYEKLPFSSKEYYDIVYKLFITHSANLQKIHDILYNMTGLVYNNRENNILTYEEKNNIYITGRKPVVKINLEILELKKERNKYMYYSENWININKKIKELKNNLYHAKINASNYIYNEMNNFVNLDNINYPVELENKISVDLHSLYIEEAKNMVLEFIIPTLPIYKNIYLITGYGKHSSTGVSELREELRKYISNLDFKKLKCEYTKNPGVLLLSEK